jgi:hypothetical protein
VSAPTRLAGFAVVLAVVFGGAALAGGAFGPDREGTAGDETRDGHEGETMDGARMGAEPAGDPVRGLAVADDGLRLALAADALPRGEEAELRFTILGAGGRAVRDFELAHERPMHLIVVRRDGRGFQHLHPEMDADGTWHVELILPDAGAYRVFADFERGGTSQTLAADLVVDGDADYRPLPAPAVNADAGDGYRVRVDGTRGVRAGREADLRFTVTRGGRAVQTEPYLGAGGHLVALREGDLAYLHVHPADDAVAFTTELPSPGRYRLYLQFKHDGRIRTAAFTLEVGR